MATVPANERDYRDERDPLSGFRDVPSNQFCNGWDPAPCAGLPELDWDPGSPEPEPATEPATEPASDLCPF